MLRSAGGVVLGYLAMAIFVFVAFSLAYAGMGANKAFGPDTYDVTGLWSVTSIVVNFVAALLGGLVCALVARGGKAPLVLAGIVLVLGIVMALPTVMNPPADLGVRPAEVSLMEAMQKAQQPAWLSLLAPVLGAVGVVLGARGRRGA
jgi:hypothetical protein